MRDINKEMEQELILKAKIGLMLRKTNKEKLTIDDYRTIKTGDRAFVKLMNVYNHRFYSLCDKYKFDDSNLEDMLQICYQVMQDKLLDYDQSKGTLLFTYLYDYLINALSEYKLNNVYCCNLPKDYLAERARYFAVLDEYKRVNGVTATDQEAAKLLGVSVSKVISYRNTTAKGVSMDANVNDDNESTFADYIPDTSNEDFLSKLEKEEQLNEIRNVLKGLSSNQREVIILKYEIFNNKKERTNSEIAKELGISCSSVGERLERGLNIIRKKLNMII